MNAFLRACGSRHSFRIQKVFLEKLLRRQYLDNCRASQIIDAKEFSRDALDPKLQSYVVRAATILAIKGMHPDRQARLAVIKAND